MKKQDKFKVVKGGRNMQAIIDKIKVSHVTNNEIKDSPWQELGKHCSDFAKKTNLTIDEAMAILEKVRTEDEGSCRY